MLRVLIPVLKQEAGGEGEEIGGGLEAVLAVAGAAYPGARRRQGPARKGAATRLVAALRRPLTPPALRGGEQVGDGE